MQLLGEHHRDGLRVVAVPTGRARISQIPCRSGRAPASDGIRVAVMRARNRPGLASWLEREADVEEEVAGDEDSSSGPGGVQVALELQIPLRRTTRAGQHRPRPAVLEDGVALAAATQHDLAIALLPGARRSSGGN